MISVQFLYDRTILNKNIGFVKGIWNLSFIVRFFSNYIFQFVKYDPCGRTNESV